MHAFGELSVKLHARTLTLRPSFAALYAIECTAGMPLPALLETLDTPAIRLIISEGLKAAGGKKPYGLRWPSLHFAARTFLLHGMGYVQEPGVEIAAETTPETVLTAKPSSGFTPLDWHALYQTATVTLSRSADEFWRMTMTELMLQCAAIAEAQGFAPASGGAPATKRDLADMQKRFPDVKSAA
ncbi:MAG: phage tail assembly chaperone [Alphaproteobacteria bacterium]|nr:phage tail assembly chaperone [Alphaproteobacteria bacterium]